MAYFQKNYNFRGMTKEERIAKKIIKAYLDSGDTSLQTEKDFKLLQE